MWKFIQSIRRTVEIPVRPTAAGVIESASKRSRLLRGVFILLGALFSYMTFTSNSASYSLFEHVASASFGLGPGHDDPIFEILGIRPSGKSLAKTAFFGFLLAAFWFMLEIAEPLSDSSQLANLASSNGKYRWSWLHRVPLAPLKNDLQAYSLSIPSAKLVYKCDRCGNAELCENVVSSQGEYILKHSVPVWVLTQPGIDPNPLARLLSATARCRLVHYWRLTFLMAGYFGVVFYFGHVIFEGLDGISNSAWRSPASWGIPAFCFTMVFLGGLFHNSASHTSSSGGVWSRFNATSEELCSRPDVAECHSLAFERVVCSKNGNSYRYSRDENFKAAQINLLDARLGRSLLAQMDVLVSEKLSRILRGNGNARLNPNEYIGGVLVAVESFFSREFLSAGGSGCTAEIIDNLDLLFTTKTKPTTRANNDIQAISDEIDRSGLAICSILGLGKAIANSRGGSIVVAPIRFSPEYVISIQDNLMASSSERTGPTFQSRGFLVIRSPDQRTFTSAKIGPIQLALSPFIHRLMYEIIRNEIPSRGTL